MRWFWIDTFVDFVPRTRASAVKNVTMAEEHLHDHFPGYPVMPPPLMIEGMAQTAGILAGEAHGFKDNVILAKIRSASFDDYARPGDQLRYDATIETLDERAAATTGVVLKNGVWIGTVDLIFSYLAPGDSSLGLPKHNFVFTEPLMSLFRTGPASAAHKDDQADAC